MGKIGAGNIEEIDIGALVASIPSTCLGGNEIDRAERYAYYIC